MNLLPFLRVFPLTAVVVLNLLACLPTDDDDDSEKKDGAAACAEFCSTNSYSSSRADEQPNELNCFCSGGTQVVTDQSCTDMCSSAGKGSGQTFSSGTGPKDSCQCS